MRTRPHPPLRSHLVVLLLLAALLPALAPPGAAQEPPEAPQAARVGGADRFDTAARISALTFPTAADVDVVHLATGQGYPDALAATYAAGAVDGPILLTGRDTLPGETLAELERLAPVRVVVIGGTGVVSRTVEEELRARGFPAERIAGGNRFETAASVALAYGGGDDGTIGTVDGDRTAILASGESYPDALAVGPIAAAANLPLLLTPTNVAEASVDEALRELAIERILIVGGDAAVSSRVEAHHRVRYTVERIAGANRMATAAAIADLAVDRFDFSPALTLLARGDDYPDALTAGIHGARSGAPILLTATPGTLSAETTGWHTRACPDVDVVRAIGGTAALSTATLAAAVEAAGACPTGEPDRDDIVAVTDDGRLVVLDAATGTPRRTVLSGLDVSDPALTAVAVTPDHATAYVAQPGAAHDPASSREILAVPLTGGEAAVVASGTAPAISPDGSTLAYTFFDERDIIPHPVLVLRDLASGDERQLARQQPFQRIADVSWTADGTAIAFTAGEARLGLYAVDAQASSLDQARRLGPVLEQHDADTSWGPVAAWRDGLAVVDRCCDLAEPQRWRVLQVDPADGSSDGPLLPVERLAATWIDADAAADRLLVVVRGDGGAGELLRWDGAGEPVSLGAGIVAAAW